MTEKQSSGLVRPPRSVARRIVVAALALAVVVQMIVPVPVRFGVDGMVGFSAVYGFLSCAVVVFAAQVFGWWLKRPEDYYPYERVFRGAATPEDPERPRYEKIDA